MSGGRRAILVVLGTRPEAIKLAPVIRALRERPEAEVRVAVTGQHRALADEMLAFAGIVPDHDLGVMRPGQSLDLLLARTMTAVGDLLEAAAPDWLVVQGDTGSALGAAIAGHHRHVPVAHVEAGLRSGDMRHPWPEEGNRKQIAALATLHFAPTAKAVAALRAENVAAEAIHRVGNTVVDALVDARARIAATPALAGELDPLLAAMQGERIVLATVHRRENHGAIAAIARAIRRIGARDGVAVVLPLHPNPAVAGPLAEALRDAPGVQLIQPLGYPAFVRLLAACHLVLSDSGGVQEEAPTFGKPVLVIRETTERPEGVEAGTARLVGAGEERIVAETMRLLDDEAAYGAMARAHNPFGDGKSAGRIADVLLPG